MLVTVVLAAFVGFSAAAQLEEVFSWKELTFEWPNDQAKLDAIKNGKYVPANNLPLGLDRWNDKLFVTVPRWKSGVAATLNYVKLNAADKAASLIPYPDWKSNTLPEGDHPASDQTIVSTFRVKVDECDRLWVMDSGLADILGSPKQITPSTIIVYDLKTDKLLRRYQLQPTDVKEDSFFANIIVDVSPDKCEDAFAYIPDLGGYGLVVYSWAANESWRVKHNYFHFDPLKGDFNVGGVNFQWTDGVFGLALGNRDENGFRRLYFHALASTKEFSVSTQIIRNKTAATSPHSYYEYKLEGDKGEKSQSSGSDFDLKANALFFTLVNRDAVGCWNPKVPLNDQNVGIVAQNNETLVFTNDIKVDRERNLWILSDKMPMFIYQELDPNQLNYRIFKVKVDDAIMGTPCAV